MKENLSDWIKNSLLIYYLRLRRMNMDHKHLPWASCLLLCLLASCGSTPPEPVVLLGTWKLNEQYIDPGNGSGTFKYVLTDKTLTFLPDGHFTSNGTMCTINSTSDNASHTGTYVLAADSIMTPDCTTPDNKIRFTMKGRTLTLSYLYCIEPCQQKFLKPQ